MILSSICKRSSNSNITITKPIIETKNTKTPTSTSQTNMNSTIFRIKKPKLDSAMRKMWSSKSLRIVDFVRESVATVNRSATATLRRKSTMLTLCFSSNFLQQRERRHATKLAKRERELWVTSTQHHLQNQERPTSSFLKPIFIFIVL